MQQRMQTPPHTVSTNPAGTCFSRWAVVVPDWRMYTRDEGQLGANVFVRLEDG